jgi:hypothetical protein
MLRMFCQHDGNLHILFKLQLGSTLLNIMDWSCESNTLDTKISVDFFYGGIMKEVVHETEIQTRSEFLYQIMNSAIYTSEDPKIIQHTVNKHLMWARLCIETHGVYFEQLLNPSAWFDIDATSGI